MLINELNNYLTWYHSVVLDLACGFMHMQLKVAWLLKMRLLNFELDVTCWLCMWLCVRIATCPDDKTVCVQIIWFDNSGCNHTVALNFINAWVSQGLGDPKIASKLVAPAESKKPKGKIVSFFRLICFWDLGKLSRKLALA